MNIIPTLLIKVFIIFSFFTHHLMACELANEQYDFKYQIDNEVLLYSIKPKKNEFITYFISKYDFTSSYGFYFDIIPQNLQEKTLDQKFLQFYVPNNLYTEYYLNNSIINFSLSSIKKNGLYKQEKEIHGSLEYIKFIEKIRRHNIKPIAFGMKNIKFRFQYALDEELKECLIFETDTIPYDFGKSFNTLKLLRERNEKK